MKNSLKTMSRKTVAYVALFGLVVSQAVVVDAWAQSYSGMQSGNLLCHATTATSTPPNNANLSVNNPTSSYFQATTPGIAAMSSCGQVTGGTITLLNTGLCPNPSYSCWTPEMSDYLAISFVMIAGGMMYHFRRRALAQA